MDPQRKTKFGLLAALGLIALLAIFVPSHSAHADGSGWLDLGSIAAGAVGWIAYTLIYILSTIVGLFIALVTYFIAVILQLSGNIVNTLAVQSGFAVTLAVANLGFVLGIIVIAIATILRRETYGIKKTLWKLVVAAILVNFSLVIGGVIIKFANTFTTTFLTAVPGGGGDNGPLAFAKILASAFSPQRAFMVQPGGTPGTIPNQPTENTGGGTVASIITPIIGVVFSAVLLIVILITLVVFLFMLLIRYVALSMLLVLMPFAWLMWLFPKTSHMWTKWWSEFIRWTFFAPIVIFFLWLAIATAQAMGDPSNPLAGTTYTATGSGLFPSMSRQFGSFIGAFAGTALQGCIVVGLAIGGMFVANKLSIMGASAGMGAMKSVGNSVKGYAGRQSKKGGRLAYQRLGGEKLSQRMMGSRIPLVSTAGRGMAGVAEKGGKDLVKQASTGLKVGDMSDDNLVLAAKGARGHDNTLAILEEAQKRGKLDKLGGVGGEKDLNAYLKKNEQVFKDYGRQDLDKNINTSLESNRLMREVAEAMAAEGAKAEVIDRNGIIAPAGTNVKATDLAEGSRKVAEDAKEAVNLTGVNTIIDHQGRRVKAGDLLNDARAASKEADDAIEAKGERVGVMDKEGLTNLEAAGQMVKAGDLLRAASEKFYAGMDKSDIAKMHPENIFGGKEKFGLSKETIDALGGAITYAMATKKPTFIAPMAGKLDSSESIRNFFDKYKAGIDKALAQGRVSKEDYALLSNSLIKGLRRGILFGYGGGGAPGAAAQNAPPPTPPPPAAPLHP